MNQFPYFIAHGNNVTLQFITVQLKFQLVLLTFINLHAGSILELNI